MAKAVTTRWLRKFYESDAASTAPPAAVPAPPMAILPAGTVAPIAAKPEPKPKRRYLHVNEYLDAARRGLTKAEAAAELGITLNGVHMASLRHGISFTKESVKRRLRAPKPVREPRRLITAEEVIRARELRASGVAWMAVAKEIGISRDSLKVAVSRTVAAERKAKALEPAPVPESPAVLAGPGGGAERDRPHGVAAPPPRDTVRAFRRTVLSISQRTGCSIEEAQHQASLQLDRMNSVARQAATSPATVTRYPTPGYRLGASLLPEAAPSRDRRAVHAPTDTSEHAT